MKAGGNAAAGLALNCKVGYTAATLAKYQSRAALDYKSRLQARTKADKAAHPTNPFAVFTPHEDEVSSGPVLTQASSAQVKNVAAPVAPSFNAPPMRKAAIGKATKLGAVKVVDVDFDQMDSHVWDDQPSFIPEDVTPVESTPPQIEKIQSQPIPSSSPMQASSAPVKKPPTMSKAQEAAVGRLGMGMKKLSLAQAQQAAPNEAPKSVSSEKFFKQSNPEEEVAVQEKLRDVRGQTSISSSDFFTNPDDDDADVEDEEYRSSSGIYSLYDPH